jgi:hypothetical protein
MSGKTLLGTLLALRYCKLISGQLIQNIMDFYPAGCKGLHCQEKIVGGEDWLLLPQDL